MCNGQSNGCLVGICTVDRRPSASSRPWRSHDVPLYPFYEKMLCPSLRTIYHSRVILERRAQRPGSGIQHGTAALKRHGRKGNGVLVRPIYMKSLVSDRSSKGGFWCFSFFCSSWLRELFFFLRGIRLVLEQCGVRRILLSLDIMREQRLYTRYVRASSFT